MGSNENREVENVENTRLLRGQSLVCNTFITSSNLVGASIKNNAEILDSTRVLAFFIYS